MLSLSVIKSELRAGKYAWPGGYPKFFVCADGETLSYEAAYENRKEIFRTHLQAPKGYHDAQWTLVGCDINWEDNEMVCAHTGKRIESAYAD